MDNNPLLNPIAVQAQSPSKPPKPGQRQPYEIENNYPDINGNFPTTSSSLSYGVNKAATSNMSSYESIIDINDIILFEVPAMIPAPVANYVHQFKVSSRTYGMVWMTLDMLSIIFFITSYATADRSTGYSKFNSLAFTYCLYYVFAAAIAIPIWQTYSIVDNKGNERHCEDSCLYWSCCSMFCGVLCCCCGSRLQRRTNEEAVTRFMPYSFYNYWFMIANPGKQMNEKLPENLENFGFGRTYFFLFCMNSRTSFNLCVFLYTFFNVIDLCSSSGGSQTIFSITLGIMSLAFTIVSEAHRYVLKTVLGSLLFPFNFIMLFAFFCPAQCWKPVLAAFLEKDSCSFMVLKKLWKICSKD